MVHPKEGMIKFTVEKSDVILGIVVAEQLQIRDTFHLSTDPPPIANQIHTLNVVWELLCIAGPLSVHTLPA